MKNGFDKLNDYFAYQYVTSDYKSPKGGCGCSGCGCLTLPVIIFVFLAFFVTSSLISCKPADLEHHPKFIKARELIAINNFYDAQQLLFELGHEYVENEEVEAYLDLCNMHVYDKYSRSVMNRLEKLDLSFYSDEELAALEKFKNYVYGEYTELLSKEAQEKAHEEWIAENRRKAGLDKKEQTSTASGSDRTGTKKKKTGSSVYDFDTSEFSHAEDFYDWYRDDFVDLEEAEDYYEEHE